MTTKRLPAQWFPRLLAFVMAGAITVIVTLVLTLALDVWEWPAAWRWLQRWLLAWVVATPSVLWLAPRARQLAARFAVSPEEQVEARRHEQQ